MSNIVPTNNLIGKSIKTLSTCHSTNDVVTDLLKNNNIESGDIVCTFHQTNGRGQRGNTWISEPNKNISLSLYMKHDNFSVQNQFDLNIITSLAVARYLKSHGVVSKVKWPNDIYINDFKIAGILIENTLKNQNISKSIIGIGININQENFEPLSATSIKRALGKTLDLNDELLKIVAQLNTIFETYFNNGIKTLKEEYVHHLFRIHETHLYEDNDGVFKGEIIGIDESGCLVLRKQSGELAHYQFKEVKYIF